MSVLADELAEVVEAALMDHAAGDGGLDRAVGFGLMLAVAEAALAEEGTELGETEFDFLGRQVLEAEFLQAGAVDQGAPVR
jgi:hypothetical protein